ncbi:serine protease [Caballeronia sp. LjRoot29]|uniref:S1 family peptidase n=1 Tax=Caballeronia sp. LjRoot29 TaxID=3342315 RepID=UPI003ECE9D7C
MKCFLSALLLASGAAFGVTPSEIVSVNSHGIVYLEVENSDGGMTDHGTGFIVSHDGYVLTADHLKPAPGQQLVAVIGQRAGTKFPLQFRDTDENADVALWQLPQSATCRYSVSLSAEAVKQFDRLVAVGFPNNDGLTPAAISVANTTSAMGFYKSDGFLAPGNSGGPIFNEAGFAVALVEGGGRPGTETNDLIPIAPAIALLKKHGVQAGIDTQIPFDISCYATCPARENGVERWTSQTDWHAHTGELSGGSNPVVQCDILKAARLAGDPDSEIDFYPGTAGHDESSYKKFPSGEQVYTYKCGGVVKSGPVYINKQSQACGLWQ